MIEFQCSSCQQPMSVGLDKAGKRARCPRCEQIQRIPMAPPAKQLPASAGLRDEDDDDGTYEFLEHAPKPPPASPELKHIKKPAPQLFNDADTDRKRIEVEELKQRELRRQQDEERAIAKRRRQEVISMRQTPVQHAMWNGVRYGLLIVILGFALALGAEVVHALVAIPAIMRDLYYGQAAATELVVPDMAPEVGVPPELHRGSFALALLSGSDGLTRTRSLLSLATILQLAQIGVCIFGYMLCMIAPPHFGTRQLMLAAIITGGAGALIVVVFRLLPTWGAAESVVLPFFVPELALLDANVERTNPLQITWSEAPLLEGLLAVLLQAILHAEHVLFGIYMYALALIFKDKDMEKTSYSLIEMGLGTWFIMLCLLMLMSVGTSELMYILLRVVYALYVGFIIGYYAWFIVFLFHARERIARLLWIT